MKPSRNKSLINWGCEGMDVKYIPSDWEKMKDGIGDLIGLGRWGKGMIDELKDLSDILEDAESDIAKYDVDGAITFQHTSQKSKYQGLFEDFDVLHNFSGKVGDIVDRTIDQPFYEDMDAFVAIDAGFIDFQLYDDQPDWGNRDCSVLCGLRSAAAV